MKKIHAIAPSCDISFLVTSSDNPGILMVQPSRTTPSVSIRANWGAYIPSALRISALAGSNSFRKSAFDISGSQAP